MTVTFVSNYINHHQIPFSDACYKELGEGYHFIQTEPMEEERVAMGWGTEGNRLPYVLCLYEEEEKCRKLMLESDMVIFGWIRREDLLNVTEVIKERLKNGKKSLRLSERLYREGQWKAVSPKGLIRKYKDHTRFRSEAVALLCAGAYVPSDFHIVRSYPGKMLRFGYFPETKYYTEEDWTNLKTQDGKVHIVWAGRFMPLKHPEFVVRLAEELQSEKKEFHIHMVGSGELEQEIIGQVQAKGLEDVFTFYGYTEPAKVRSIMEKCQIHLFTSNYLEGWGAVVNEAMNSGCAVVANVEAGAVPYLIQHEENGLIYNKGLYEDFARQVKRLVNDRQLTAKLGKAAYQTITGLWNAEHAAKELLRFCEDWMSKGEILPAKEGPLSVAPVIAPGKMYRTIVDEKSGKNI